MTCLHGKAVLQVKEARLTHILHLGTTLTHHRGFVPALCARFPAKDGEGSHADFAFDAIVFLLHANIGIITWTVAASTETEGKARLPLDLGEKHPLI